ncbi:MAG: hypothetical protein WCL44_01315 [bacterium]
MMKKFTSGRIKELLGGRASAQAPDAVEFWSDFRARAKLVNQDRLGEPVAVPFAVRWRVAATACAAVVVAAGGLFLFRGDPGEEPTGQMTLDVTAAHSAVLVIEDESSQGTIVWIVGMEDGESNGDRA